MKKVCLFGLMFCATSLFSSSFVAIAKDVNKKVEVKRGSDTVFIKDGAKLFENDVVMTKKGKVLLAFNDGSILNLGPNSFLTIEKFTFKPYEKEYDFKLDMKKGVGVFESGRLGKLSPESFALKVPQGIIGVRGTKFLIDIK